MYCLLFLPPSKVGKKYKTTNYSVSVFLIAFRCVYVLWEAQSKILASKQLGVELTFVPENMSRFI